MAYFKIPASASKAAKARMLEDRLRPTKKPDVDNIIKIVLDALNNTAWHDDAQVTDVICEKHYGIIPRVEVTVPTLAVLNTQKEEKGVGTAEIIAICAVVALVAAALVVLFVAARKQKARPKD